MRQIKLEKESYALIIDYFGLEEEKMVYSKNIFHDRFVDQLMNRINEMLDNDFNGLLNLLYRIDVDENKSKQELAISDHDLSKRLTTLIIKRINDKIVFRNRWRSKA